VIIALLLVLIFLAILFPTLMRIAVLALIVAFLWAWHDAAQENRKPVQTHNVQTYTPDCSNKPAVWPCLK